MTMVMMVMMVRVQFGLACREYTLCTFTNPTAPYIITRNTPKLQWNTVLTLRSTQYCISISQFNIDKLPVLYLVNQVVCSFDKHPVAQCSDMPWSEISSSAVQYTYITVQCSGVALQWKMLQCNALDRSAGREGGLWPVLSQDGKITCSRSQQHPAIHQSQQKSRFVFFRYFSF